MKIVVISDTHGQHDRLGELSGDVLIHCGDIGLASSESSRDLDRLDLWFGSLRFGAILCTGGNHDFGLERVRRQRRSPFRHATYLEDSGVSLDGVRFYGAPWVPELSDWAFFQDDASLADRWARIPDDTDVLITHTPPFGVLDSNSAGRHCGCPALRRRVEQLSLRAHCFGHIHASAGVMSLGATQFVNAAVVDSQYRVARGPIELVDWRQAGV